MSTADFTVPNVAHIKNPRATAARIASKSSLLLNALVDVELLKNWTIIQTIGYHVNRYYTINGRLGILR